MRTANGDARGLDWRIVAAFVAAKLVFHVVTAPGYGWFRDELYYLACADHLALGYVDHPPLSIVVLAATRAAFGDSLIAIRSVIAVVGALNVLVVAGVTAELGGDRYAQALAMLAVLAAPLYLALDHFYSMNAFDLLLWPLSAWLLLRAIRGEGTRRWLLLGVVLGLGLLNKIGVLWLGFGFTVGLLATSARAELKRPGPWLCAATALLLFVPHLWWQATHDWPTIEFIANATGSKMKPVSPIDFVLGQLEAAGFVSAPIWILGLVALLRGRHHAPGRVLGLAYLTVLVLLILAGTSRVGYLAPAYGWLFPAGAIAIERRLHRVSLRALILAVVGLAGAITAPFAVPILPVDRYLAYAEALGQAPTTAERKELAALPQHYADMHGWEDLVEDIADGWQAIPEDERASAVIFTNNYGEAGAVDHFGPAHGLPPAISGHNNYHLWGTRGREGSTMLIIGADGLTRDVLERAFEEVEQVGRIDCGYCMPYENGSALWVLRGRRSGETLAERWPQLAHFD